MYTFSSGDESLTLRPEMTASVVRAYVQHGLSRVAGSGAPLLPRADVPPRAARRRGARDSSTSSGVEAFGSDDAYVDAETIEMIMAMLRTLGVGGLRLVINSVGCNEEDCRPRYRERPARSGSRPSSLRSARTASAGS